MPKHYCTCPKGSKCKTKKGSSNKMKTHSKHHSVKHMEMMRRDMSKGMSFNKAHQKAMKLVGK